jgi:hypothetical protein
MPMRSCKTSGHTVASEGASRMPAPSPVLRTESFHCATLVSLARSARGASDLSDSGAGSGGADCSSTAVGTSTSVPAGGDSGQLARAARSRASRTRPTCWASCKRLA